METCAQFFCWSVFYNIFGEAAGSGWKDFVTRQWRPSPSWIQHELTHKILETGTWVSAVFQKQHYLYTILFQCYLSCLKASFISDPSLMLFSLGQFSQWVVKFRLWRLTGQSPACSKSPLGPVLPMPWARPQPVPPSHANLTAVPPGTPWGPPLGVSLGSHAREGGGVALLPCACRPLYRWGACCCHT